MTAWVSHHKIMVTHTFTYLSGNNSEKYRNVEKRSLSYSFFGKRSNAPPSCRQRRADCRFILVQRLHIWLSPHPEHSSAPSTSENYTMALHSGGAASVVFLERCRRGAARAVWGPKQVSQGSRAAARMYLEGVICSTPPSCPSLATSRISI